MRTKRRKKIDDSETSAIFARIPMEKLSGMDEMLWLEQVSSKKTDDVKKLKRKSRKE